MSSEREKYKYIYFVDNEINGVYTNKVDSKQHIKNHPEAKWCYVFTTKNNELVSSSIRDEKGKIIYQEIV